MTTIGPAWSSSCHDPSRDLPRDSCNGTPDDPTRRDFLHQATGCVLAALLAASAGVAEASAEPGPGDQRRYPLPASDGVTIDRSAQVILVRAQGKIFAMALSCPHQNAAVKWLPNEARFQCSKHDSKYQPDGTYTSGRATRNLDRFPIHRDGDGVVVDVSRVYQSSQDQAGWAAACVVL